MLGENRSTEKYELRCGDESGVEKKSWRTGFFRKSHLAKNHQLENGFDEKEVTFSNTCLIFMVWWFMGCLFFSHANWSGAKQQTHWPSLDGLPRSRVKVTCVGAILVSGSLGSVVFSPTQKNILKEQVHWKMWFSYQLLYLNEVSRIEVDVFAPLYLLCLDLLPCISRTLWRILWFWHGGAIPSDISCT